MRKAKILVIFLLTLPLLSVAQLDCSGFLRNMHPEAPFKLNSLSKSAACVSGHTYEFVVPVQKGYEYRIIFYASSVFNNDMKFKITDLNTNTNIVDLPGELSEFEIPKKGQTALQSYYDEKINKEVHPYTAIIPSNTTNLKIIIDIKEKPELLKGCVTVVILDKLFSQDSF